MPPASPLTLRRDCRAVQIPSGEYVTLPAGTLVTVHQSLGGSYTVQAPSLAGLFRLAGADADALGLQPEEPAAAESAGPVDEESLWAALRGCYDPEIPVNVVDLGLVYDLGLSKAPAGGTHVGVKMTLTAPGCGMGPAIAADARHKLLGVPGVVSAEVTLVWDPPWSAEMMSPAGKKALGIA